MPDETWYAQPNDEVGGWCVMTTDNPPTTAAGRMVATFTAEADARRIADLHNAESGGSSAIGQQTRTVAEDAARKWALRYPIPAWGLAEGERADRLAETWARVVAGMVLDALSAAGRLLPEGGETTVETEVVWLKDGRERDTHTYENLTDEYWAQELAAATKYGVDLGPRRRREVCTWPDGSTLVGPWVAVDQEAGDG